MVSNWDRFGAAIGLEYPVYRAEGFAARYGMASSRTSYPITTSRSDCSRRAVAFRAIQRSPFGMFLVAIREEQAHRASASTSRAASSTR